MQNFDSGMTGSPHLVDDVRWNVHLGSTVGLYAVPNPLKLVAVPELTLTLDELFEI